MHTRETSDLGLASFLVLAGYKLVGVPIKSGRRSAFVFEGSDELEQAICSYYGRRTSVDALGFSEQLRNFKSLVV